MIYDFFVDWVEAKGYSVTKIGSTRHRLDGLKDNSNWKIFGCFKYAGTVWGVRSNTHLDTVNQCYLLVKFAGFKDPFIIEKTKEGRCLRLKQDFNYLQPYSRFHVYEQPQALAQQAKIHSAYKVGLLRDPVPEYEGESTEDTNRREAENKKRIAARRQEDVKRRREEKGEFERQQQPGNDEKRTKGIRQVRVDDVVLATDMNTRETARYHLSKPTGCRLPCSTGAHFCIGHEAPVFEAFIHKFVGDTAIVCAPAGNLRYKIVSVQAPPHKIDSKQKPSSAKHGSQEKTINPSQGSETWAYVARDNGQFGSFPKHDNYGDEANADVKDYDDYVDYTMNE